MALGLNHNQMGMDSRRWVRPAQRRAVDSSTPAVATLTLAVILIIVMFIEVQLSRAQLTPIVDALALRSTVWSWTDVSGYGPILTHSLLHGSSAHFFWNVITLVLVGTVVEWRLGWRVVAGLFVVGAIVGGLSHLLIFPMEARPLIGASGVVSTLFGATFVVAGNVGLRVRIPRTARWLRLNTRRLLFVWLTFQVYCLAPALVSSSKQFDVAYWAHLAGFAVGVAAGLIYQSRNDAATAPAAFASAGD